MRVDFPIYSPSRTPHESSHETSHEGVHGRAHEWQVGVHLSCFHLLCSLTITDTEPTRLYLFQRTAKGASGKGPRQKSSKNVKNIFDTFRRHFSRRAKNVRNRQEVSKYFSTFFDNFARHPFSSPFWGALIILHYPGEKRHININFLLWFTCRWPWDKWLVVPGLTGPKSLCVRLETQEI